MPEVPQPAPDPDDIAGSLLHSEGGDSLASRYLVLCGVPGHDAPEGHTRIYSPEFDRRVTIPDANVRHHQLRPSGAAGGTGIVLWADANTEVRVERVAPRILLEGSLWDRLHELADMIERCILSRSRSAKCHPFSHWLAP